jgi:hypothetical protein
MSLLAKFSQAARHFVPIKSWCLKLETVMRNVVTSSVNLFCSFFYDEQ